MATLEKIRQQKFWLAVLIGGALLAFIIEVGVEAIGRSAGKSVAAKVGNEKIDIMEFSKRVEQDAANDKNQQQYDAAQRNQKVLDEMINEKLLNKEYEKLGIYVTDSELSELTIGKNPAPAIVQFAQQLNAKSPAELYDFITNPGKHGIPDGSVAELRNEWNKMTNEVVKGYKQLKLQNLIAGCMQANDLDRAQMAEDEAMTNVVLFAKQAYSTLPDDQFPVTDEELKAEWMKHQSLFKLDEETRAIHYIAVNIEPSAADIAAAQKIADAAYIALQKGRGIDSVRVLGTVRIDTAKMLQKDMPASVRDLFAGAQIGTTRRDSVMNNHHVMYKLINKEVSLDSVELVSAAVQGDAKTQKSVLDQLNAGKSLDELRKAFPQKFDANEKAWQRIYNLPDSLKAKIANAAPGVFVTFASGDQGAQYIKVTDKKAPKTFYTVATVSYDAYASTKTSEDLRDKLQNFLNKNKTVKEFTENAAKEGFNAVETMISPSTPQLGMGQFGYGGIKDTRKAIKWAFDNNKGDVSPIFSDNNTMLVAVAIDDIYKEGVMDYNVKEVKELLTTLVRNSKKGDALVQKLQGKANSLDAYAGLMNTQVDTVDVSFGMQNAPKLADDYGVIGRMATAKVGELKGPWKGQNSVYVYQVLKQEKAERQPTKEELDQRYAQTRGAQIFANPRTINGILSKATKVKKQLIDFY
ncbi:MAG: SurA N-terminal domain-containing protein [Muribaculaceae bacterium]|nr:SurA N-terminal domain-containing protein [Muribaculaceae bacterium]